MSGNDRVLVVAGQPPGMLQAAELAAQAAAALPTRREAIRATVAVACFVGAPALAAVGAVVALFALSAAVLLAPLVAAVLTWTAWRCNRVHADPGAAPAGREPERQDAVSPR